MLWLLVTLWSAIYQPICEAVQTLPLLLITVLSVSEVVDTARLVEPLLARIQPRVDLVVSSSGMYE